MNLVVRLLPAIALLFLAACEPPAGHESNWIQTMPSKSFNVLLRLYGALPPWFDKSWNPGDFALVE